MLTDAQVFF